MTTLKKFASGALRQLVTLSVVVAILAAPTMVSSQSCTTFSDPIVLDRRGDVELQHLVNYDEGTFTMKVTYYGGRAYIGIGVNQEGTREMTPAVAVIGTNEGDVPLVSKYMMTWEDEYLVLPMTDSEQQGVVQSTFEQTDSMSILTFTQLLSEPNQVAITDDTQWMYAIGYDENGWGGHSDAGSFQLSLSSCTGGLTTGSENPSSFAPTDSTSNPTDSTSNPSDSTSNPTDSTSNPSDSTSVPSDSTSVPKEVDEGETDSTSAPTDAIAEETQQEEGDGFVPTCPFSEPIALAGNLELEQFVDEASNSFTMRLTYYGGQAWISVGINEDGRAKMSPAMAVIGRADGGARVEKYSLPTGYDVELADSSLQTLLYSSFEQTGDTSTLIFTQLLNEDGQAPITDSSQWIYAVGYDGNSWSGHGIQGGFQLALSSTCDGTSATGSESNAIILTEIEAANRALWMTHGVFMALAWGLFAPLAVGAAVLRVYVDRLAGEKNKGLWFKVHLSLNVLVLLLTIIGFAIAYVAKRQGKEEEEEEEEEEKIEGVHGRLGIAIMVLVVLQSIAGYFRPGLPKPVSEDKMDTRDHTEKSDATKSEEFIAQKSLGRMAWEVLHRVSGMALLGMGWYNCHTGIIKASTMLEDYKDWTGAFWIVVSTLGGLIVIGKLALTISCNMCVATEPRDGFP
jgi:Eukaryotic cytochrome b561